MNIPVGTAVVLTLVLKIISATTVLPSWNDKLHGALQAMDRVIQEVDGPQYNTGLSENHVKDLIDVLETLLSELEGFERLDTSVKRIQASQARTMTDEVMKPKVDRLYPSDDLKDHYELGSMLKKLRRTNDLDSMCTGVQKISYKFTTKAICLDVLECSEQDVACTADNKCDVSQAIPKMVAVLWYKVGAFLSNGLCSPVTEEVLQDFKSVKDMVDNIGAYASSTVEWNAIFEDIERTGQVFFKLNLAFAMELFETHEKVAKFGFKACKELKSEKMCPVGYIYIENMLLKVLKRNKQEPLPVRNLKNQGRVNHAQMMDLKKGALNQIKLLATIENIDADMKTISNEVSKYFHTLSVYDQGIADQDVLFIKGKLKEFEKKTEKLTKKVREDFRSVKNFAIGTKIAEQVENFMTDGFEALKGLQDAIVAGNTIAGLEEDSQKLFEDTKNLAEAFKRNADQISAMQEIVERIRTGHIGGVGTEGIDFINAYGAYTPQVDDDLLARNDALWSAYKDKACELLLEAEGLAASATQTVVGLSCEKLEGTLAEFSAVRESILEFQFDLVDALAVVIRGQIGKELSKGIDMTTTSNRYSNLMSFFFRTQSRLQLEASLYCDTQEYLNHGKSIYGCSSNDLFTVTDIENLIAYQPDTHYDIEERFVYIPTKPQFHGDEGYINLATLEKEHKVSFRLPANKAWLNDFNWLANEENVPPFVESFKVYLPRKKYDVTERRTKHSKTRIQVTSKGGSFVDLTANAKKVKYIVPEENSQYVTVYEEGYDPAKCPRGKEILNPYSLCDNLPFMCDTTTRVPKSRVMPTILSRWELSFSVETGAEALSWDVPNPATDLLIIAKVELRFPPGIRKRSRIARRDESAFGCCGPRQYRPSWRNNACRACPNNTPSKMGGYYCEYKNKK